MEGYEIGAVAGMKDTRKKYWADRGWAAPAIWLDATVSLELFTIFFRALANSVSPTDSSVDIKYKLK